MTNVTDEVLGRIARQLYEVFRRVREGSLDSNAVSTGLQLIIERKLPTLIWTPPTWWRTPERQLAKACELWPNAILPEPPEKFVPRTETEVLLLHVPDTFDRLWDAIVAPEGYAKYHWDAVSPASMIHLTPDRIKPVWLAFDPEYGRGKRPDKLRGQPGLAASEVLSAAIQFPNWCLSWCKGSSAPTWAATDSITATSLCRVFLEALVSSGYAAHVWLYDPRSAKIQRHSLLNMRFSFPL